MSFFRNRVQFSLEEPRKVKEEVLVLVFQTKEDLKNKKAFRLLPKNLQEFLKQSLQKTQLPEDEHIHLLDSPWGSVILCQLKKILHHRAFYLKARQIFRFAQEHQKAILAVYLADWPISDLTFEEALEKFIVNCLLADFDFSQYYQKKKKQTLQKVVVFLDQASKYRQVLKTALIVGEETNRARFFSNLPGGDLTPKDMVDFCQSVARESGLRIKVLNTKALAKLKAGAILGVGCGSKHEPYLVVLEYRSDRKLPEVHLVGKGITFDTGGLHLKSADYMSDMHLDMSGAASFLSATSMLARLNLPANVITLLAIAENMPSGESYRPGDILRSISGKTLEIGSTDAEGRVVMADAIDYGKKFYQPKLIITLATLTGAAMVALGSQASALFSSREEFLKPMQDFGEKSGDYLWPLPLWEEYAEEIKGKFAEVTNYPGKRYGGAIHGAQFLWYFVKPNPFIHIDMAPRMTADEKEFLHKGSVGFGVRLIKEFFQNQKEIFAHLPKSN